jgi:hypothetical protein
MNAMLRERILPVGMGHTTNCFLQVRLIEIYLIKAIVLFSFRLKEQIKLKPMFLHRAQMNQKVLA